MALESVEAITLRFACELTLLRIGHEWDKRPRHRIFVSNVGNPNMRYQAFLDVIQGQHPAWVKHG